MGHPNLLERVRMALAEAGYPNAAVELHPTDGVIVWGGNPADPPDEVTWMALGVAAGPDRDDSYSCFECWMLGGQQNESCLADRPLVRDCGVQR